VTIEARKDIPNRVQVEHVNNLPSFNKNGPGLVQGLLSVDQTIHWADPLQAKCPLQLDCTPSGDPNNPCCQPFTGPEPTTVHLHGAEISACFDGGPDTWFTPAGQTGPQYCTLVSAGPGKAIYFYPNSQEPGTLWFHDHALGVTRNNVFAGLAGFYFVRDPSTEPKKLPSGPYEIEMAIQDHRFDTKSRIYFTGSGPGPAAWPDPQNGGVTPNFHPFWYVQFYGDVVTVNGAVWPYLKVEPRRYRFRLLDGANGRRLDLHFVAPEGKEPPPVYQIGADDQYFDTPVKVNDTACAGKPITTVCSDVSLLPGERADIIVDFTNLAGQTITVTNTGPSVVPVTDVIQFQVVLPLSGHDNSCDPAKPNPTAGICARKYPIVRLIDGQGNVVPKIDKRRQLIITELNTTDGGKNPTGEIEQFVNNTYWNGLEWPNIQKYFPDDGISELPQVGSTELWEIINFENATQAWHPIHTHLVQFQILNRQNLALDSATGKFFYEEAWNAAFPASCDHEEGFCPGYGPPLPYNTANADGSAAILRSVLSFRALRSRPTRGNPDGRML
jgi:spore coat protein A